MAFFEYVPEDWLAPEVKESIDVLKKRRRSDRISLEYYAYANNPRVLKAYVEAIEGFLPIPSRFGACQHIAGMLIAHAKGCRACFNGSWKALFSLGFDEATLDNMCEAPATVPLPERERCVVEFMLRVASGPQSLKADDFREMERAGFAKYEILEMIGVAGFWNLATTLASAVDAGLREE